MSVNGAETKEQRQARIAERDARSAEGRHRSLAAAHARRDAARPAIDAAEAEVTTATAALKEFDAQPKRRKLVSALRDARARLTEAKRGMYPVGSSMNPRKS